MSDEKQTARDLEKEAAQLKADEVNKTRSGKGLRQFVGATRGKGSVVITYEQFDVESPETVPSSVEEFCSLTGIDSDAEITSLLIEGYNDKLYKEASDPIAEFVVESWPADVKNAFRLAVRNTAKASGMSFDDVAAFLVPQITKKLSSVS